ncbi:peptide chain release factor N(5)-glutamine methyltransferase [Hydrogenovibrio halophilus]|uniref:peptide chain release factor N(5)-glutamine methyltransferase n=1 Tax=Hydrogenovibrio halophilus TaxID=373391 RepID=UPI000367020C|nr:peptide chain release factor N(5)-glutamine methyltransferase [Hydrogenovibrio halophilus]
MTPAPTYEQARQTARQRLKEKGLEEAALEADLLLMAVIEQPRSALFTWPERPLSAEQANRLAELVNRRCEGEPVAYILGQREFWGLTLRVTPDTLIPRPDTELLVETAFTLQREQSKNNQAWSFLDLGTGSGAIICALKNALPESDCHAVDRSEAALAVARQNGRTHGLDIHWHLGNWFAPVNGLRFDCVVANPPYVEPDDPHLSQGDLRFEPQTALVAQQHGLADLRQIIEQAPAHLNPGGWLLLEHGYNQAEAVQSYFSERLWHPPITHTDLGGQPRVTMAQTMDPTKAP